MRESKSGTRGYIVVDANYSTLGTVEEYIDLLPIPEDLTIEPDSFLEPIHKVVIHYDEFQ